MPWERSILTHSEAWPILHPHTGNTGRMEGGRGTGGGVMEKASMPGKEHPDTLRSNGNLHPHTGTRAMEGGRGTAGGGDDKSKHALGEEHPGTLRSMPIFASTYRDQGRWKEAEALGCGDGEKASMPWERST